MIPFEEAHAAVLDYSQNYGEERVPLQKAMGRVLAEDILADRDFPPFNRATMDGIAISNEAIKKGWTTFKIQATLAAGIPTIPLNSSEECIEIMTGAVVPDNANAVLKYEELEINQGTAKLNAVAKSGQNIHSKGSDRKEGEILIHKHRKLSSAEIGVLAAVGKSEVKVKVLPKVLIISTGNELVETNQNPLPHQIRKSNSYSLHASLSEENMNAVIIHLEDDLDIIRQRLAYATQEMDVLMISGGVSKGKFDFLPQALEELGVEKIFHRVAQRPGKPFWFGNHKPSKTVVFSFPGNPVSTFVNYHAYFRDWLRKSTKLPLSNFNVILMEELKENTVLTRFLGVSLEEESGRLIASLVNGNGSGDLNSLTDCDGFIRVSPSERKIPAGSIFPFVPTRRGL